MAITAVISSGFPLEEERESLAIQALLHQGQSAAARTRAVTFHERWPDSLFGPVIDAALQ